MGNPTLTSDNYVIVRAWLPTNYGKIVSYPEAVLRRTFTPWNTHAHIGHVSIEIHYKDEMTHEERTQYISLYPTESHYFSTSPAVNHTLEEDITDQEKFPPTLQATIFSLDTKKMLDKFDGLQPIVRWFLTGVKIINLSHEQIYNCSSYAEKILDEGGIYTKLLSSKQKLSKPMTPEQVCKLAQHAEKVEEIIVPERKALLKKHFENLGNQLINCSQHPYKACKEINNFLQQNPDLYVRATDYDPNFFNRILPIVYKNIQQSLNEYLLYLAEHFDLNKKVGMVLEIQKTIENGANQLFFNKDGLNALHLMIKNDCLEGVIVLVDKFPSAISERTKYNTKITPLDIALEIGNERIINFLKKKLEINAPSLNRFNMGFFNDKKTLSDQTPNSEATLNAYHAMKQTLNT